MALSLLSQQQQPTNFFDLQTFFDPLPFPLQQHQYPHNHHHHHQQQHQQQQQQQQQQQYHQQQQQGRLGTIKSIIDASSKIDPIAATSANFCTDQMEYNATNLHHSSHYQQQINSNNNSSCSNSNSNSNSSNDNNNSNSSSNNNNINISNSTSNTGGICNNNNNNTVNSNNSKTNSSHSTGNNQTVAKTNRYYMNGYSHHHIASDYVISFVDSPPNSEESWTDEQSKGSPGPQIIDVQTIYSNSGSRKRRMDWDSLDIGQSGNPTSAQPGELATKIAHHEKDKHKRERPSARGSWTEDIGFDLNTDFNSNSYLSNESFLSFSPALTVLKQEPQTDQLKTIKNHLSSQPVEVGIAKKDKSPPLGESVSNNEETPKNVLNNSLCGCGSPKSLPQDIEQNGNNVQKPGQNGASGYGNAGNVANLDKSQSVSGNVTTQQLTLVDPSKIESISNGNTNNSATTNSDDHKFQYILAAATSIATKNNEETLTYLNQGQSYEIKLKKIGDLSFYRDKILKSVVKICFHERRLQFMEREQMQQWQASRPGERIIEVDVPLSYGLCHVSQPLNPNYLNTVEILWDPLKEVGVYIKVNCISTEFTPKKHGGEKGVPFRLQIETYIETTNTSTQSGATTSPSGTASSGGSTSSGSSAPLQIGLNSAITSGNLTTNSNLGTVGPGSSLIGGKQAVHAAACQIKVFKLKGADRKHKQDREKIQKRPQSEQDKFQPSYECTIMNDIPLDLIIPAGSGCFSPEYMKIWPNSPVHIPKYDGMLPYPNASPAANSSPIAINSVTSTNSPTLKLMDANMVSPQQTVVPETDEYAINIMPETTPAQVAQWLTHHRLTAYLSTFAHFSGSDIMRMSKEDLIQICGLADGIRMFNILRAKAIAPRLTIYVSMDGNNFNAIYLVSNTSKELMQKLCKMPGFYEMIANGATNGPMESGAVYNSWGMHSKYSGSGSNIFNDGSKNFIFVAGPSGVHVTITDEVLSNEIKDGSLFTLEVQSGKVVMKLINKNDNN